MIKENAARSLENRNPKARDRTKTGPTPRRARRTDPSPGRDLLERALAAKRERDRAESFRKNLAAIGGNAIKPGTSGALAMHLDSTDADIPDPPNRRARRILAHYATPMTIIPGMEHDNENG